VTEAFDKQTQVKLNSEGINHGNTEWKNKQTW
jgi:hypothetical protein